jgi:peptidyl-prolyl cis-trans isomerase B (cyclophilin B)
MTKICMELTNGKKINIDIDEQNAPISAENFLKYVDEGFFDGLIFHRVIPGFMIQGGGFTAEGQGLKEKRATYPAIKGEFDSNGVKNTIKHVPGTISMARTMFKNSATTQFFICVNDCAYLDGEYAGFGKVSDQESLDVAIEISKVKTHFWQGYDDIPNEPVVIKTIKRV